MATEDDSLNELLAEIKADMERPTLMNKVYWRGQRIEKALVTRDPRSLREVRWTFAGYWLLAMTVYIVALVWAGTSFVGISIGIVAFALGARCATLTRNRSQAYHAGWLQGRAACYAAMREGADNPGRVVGEQVMKDMSIMYRLHP